MFSTRLLLLQYVVIHGFEIPTSVHLQRHVCAEDVAENMDLKDLPKNNKLKLCLFDLHRPDGILNISQKND